MLSTMRKEWTHKAQCTWLGTRVLDGLATLKSGLPTEVEAPPPTPIVLL